jgi:hypothetical protein
MDCPWATVVENKDIDASPSKAGEGGPSVNLTDDERQNVEDSEACQWYLGRAPRQLH